MKTYKNPEPLKIEIMTIHNENKIFEARLLTGRDLDELIEIAKQKELRNFENVAKQLEFIYGESKEWLLDNIHGSVLNEILKDTIAEYNNPIKG